MGENIQKMNDMVFSFGELGFQEFETSKYLTDILKQNGFTIRTGVAGIPTAFDRDWGIGQAGDRAGLRHRRHPAGVAEARRRLARTDRRRRARSRRGAQLRHAAEHAAALAVKKVMEQQHLQGTLKLWPGVAEELDGAQGVSGTRRHLQGRGHLASSRTSADNFDVSWGDAGNQTGLVSVEYAFKGESAHAAARRGADESALDAVELMDVGWNFRREHLRLRSARITSSPTAATSPTSCRPMPRSGITSARSTTRTSRTDVGHRQQDGEGGDDDDRHRGHHAPLLGSAWPGHFNKTIAEDMYANIEKVGLPQWSEADQALAKALQKELKVPEVGLPTKIQPSIARPRGDPAPRKSAAAAPTTSATFRGTCRR